MWTLSADHRMDAESAHVLHVVLVLQRTARFPRSSTIRHRLHHGHEFTGEVVEVGESIKSVRNGDLIVTPFTLSCGECFYCKHGFSSRCERSLLFGTIGLDGGQAGFTRIPLADSTVVKAPKEIDVSQFPETPGDA